MMLNIKDIDKIYDDYLENNDKPAPESVKNAYNQMIDAFNVYLNEVLEYSWKDCFEYAMKITLGGGVK